MKTVGLLVTCLADLFRPEIGFAAARLLERAGYRVEVPPQGCCGQPAFNSGEDEKALQLARRMIEAFAGCDYVVAPSGSCAAMVRVHFPELAADDAAWSRRARALAEKTWELSRFLVEVAGMDGTGVRTQLPEGCRVSYHDSCSGLRELGIRDQPRRLLESSGISINETADSEICCGFGGTFCLKYPEISTRMVDNKINGLEQAGADLLVGGDLGCLMNIAGRLKRRGKAVKVLHYAELLNGECPESGVADKRTEE